MSSRVAARRGGEGWFRMTANYRRKSSDAQEKSDGHAERRRVSASVWLFALTWPSGGHDCDPGENSSSYGHPPCHEFGVICEYDVDADHLLTFLQTSFFLNNFFSSFSTLLMTVLTLRLLCLLYSELSLTLGSCSEVLLSVNCSIRWVYEHYCIRPSCSFLSPVYVYFFLLSVFEFSVYVSV